MRRLFHYVAAVNLLNIKQLHWGGGNYVLPNDEWTHSLNKTIVNLNGGTLILRGHWNGNELYAVNATGGNIIIDCGNKEKNSPVILNLTINGNVTVEGVSGFGMENGNSYNYPFAPTFASVTINSGTVNLKEVSMWRNNPFVINGGDVTLTNAMFVSDNGNHKTGDPNKKVEASIILNNGKLTLNKNEFPGFCYNDREITNKYLVDIQGGECVVTDRQVAFENDAICGDCLFNVQKEGKLAVSKGSYSGSIMTNKAPAFIQSEGEVKIEDGEFLRELIIIKGGKLTVNGGTFERPVEYDNKQRSCFYVLGKTDVKLSGGTYEDNAFYIDKLSGVKAENMLAEGYGFYTLEQALQPDVRCKPTKVTYGDYIRIAQIKSINANTPANNCRDAALAANIGPEGTDVKVIPTTVSGAYDYEINTPQGLCWLMTALNGYWDDSIYEVEVPAHGYHNINSEISTIRLTADLDMSGYDWIPISVLSVKKFDGQGHRIYNLKVEQASAAFILQTGFTSKPTEIANLVVSGSFTCKNTAYYKYLNIGAYGLTCSNSEGSKIVNCGVENSTININYNNGAFVRGAGLAMSNSGIISNCYFTGSVNGTLTYNEKNSTLSFAHLSNLVTDNDVKGIMENLYTNAPMPQCTVTPAEYQRKAKAAPICVNQEGRTINCYVAEDAQKTLDVMNDGVINHTDVQGETLWKMWTTEEGRNKGFPIHGEDKDPSVVAMPFTLRAIGNGVLEGYLVRGENESCRFEATNGKDTTVMFTNSRTYHVIARPNKGASLDSLVRVTDNALREPLEGYEALQDTSFKVSLPTQFIAYFHTDTLVIENDTTIIGGVGEITEVEHMDISVGTKEDPAVVELSNVTVSGGKEEGGEESKPTTNISQTANVTLKISGNNNLGTLVNEGTTTITADEIDNVSLTTTAVVNKGTLTDETGQITEVKGGDDSETILLKVGKKEDVSVTEGAKATVEATATVPNGASVTFKWQKWESTSWADIEGAITTYPKKEEEEVVTRSADLRAEEETGVTYTNNYETEALSEEGTLKYRCMITTEPTVLALGEGEGETATVKTTLTFYATVKVAAQTATVTITFNANGGEVEQTSVTINKGGTISSLPEPTRSGYIFKGWFTEESGGDEVTEETTFDANATIYAHWKKKVRPDKPTDIENVESAIKVYSGQNTLVLESAVPAVVSVVDMSGTLLYNKKIVGKVYIPVRHSGVYVVKVRTGKTTVVKKLSVR